MKVLSSTVMSDGGNVSSSVIIEQVNGVVNQFLKVFSNGVKILDTVEIIGQEIQVPQFNPAQMQIPSVEQLPTQEFIPEEAYQGMPEVPNQDMPAQNSAEASAKQKKTFNRWTVEEEVDLLMKFLDDKSVEEISAETNGRRNENAIRMRLVKIKEAFVSNDPKKYAAIESGVFGNGVSREILSKLISSINFEPKKAN